MLTPFRLRLRKAAFVSSPVAFHCISGDFQVGAAYCIHGGHDFEEATTMMNRIRIIARHGQTRVALGLLGGTTLCLAIAALPLVF